MFNHVKLQCINQLQNLETMLYRDFHLRKIMILQDSDLHVSPMSVKSYYRGFHHN
jgi:hypothetical protein